jgi:hypothetical protein
MSSRELGAFIASPLIVFASIIFYLYFMYESALISRVNLLSLMLGIPICYVVMVIFGWPARAILIRWSLYSVLSLTFLSAVTGAFVMIVFTSAFSSLLGSVKANEIDGLSLLWGGGLGGAIGICFGILAGRPLV